MEVTVLDKSGKDTGRKVQLSDTVFNVEENDHTVYLEVKQYLANQRQGTSKSKERAEISGSTRKIKRQKGTGTARAGSIKSPVFKGGGRAFGPRPRDYHFKLNKKVKRLAKKVVLSAKAKSNNIVVVEDFVLESAKTKNYVQFAKDLGIENKALVVTKDLNENLMLAGRNVQRSKVTTVNELSTFDIMNANKIVLLETSISEIENILS
jgi:large subunit ribosomal protein L4